MKLSLVAAVARDGAIGRGNELLFREPADQRHFRSTTIGHAVLMGRRTWESLPGRFRPLPERRNVVLSRKAGYAARGAEVVPDLDAALALLAAEDVVYVIGGGDVYAQVLPLADELLLTEVDRIYDGADTFFPAFDRTQFVEVERRGATAADGTPYAFVTCRRRR